MNIPDDLVKEAKELFPFDVYCDVIPHAKSVFCNADNQMYDLQQLNGEVLRKAIALALLEAEKRGAKDVFPIISWIVSKKARELVEKEYNLMANL